MCFTIPCRAIPYHAIPCHAMPCHAIPCHAIPYHTIPCHTIPYHGCAIRLALALFCLPLIRLARVVHLLVGVAEGWGGWRGYANPCAVIGYVVPCYGVGIGVGVGVMRIRGHRLNALLARRVSPEACDNYLAVRVFAAPDHTITYQHRRHAALMLPFLRVNHSSISAMRPSCYPSLE